MTQRPASAGWTKKTTELAAPAVVAVTVTEKGLPASALVATGMSLPSAAVGRNE